MPGIFLSNSLMREKVAHRKSTKHIVLLWVSCIFFALGILFFVLYKAEPAKVVDLPAMHTDFIGREEELAALERRLLMKPLGRSINLAAICGQSGIGKTELAITFAHKHMADFSLIAWIDATSNESLVHSYAKLADMLQIHEVHPELQRDKVHLALEQNKGQPWLLIIDDLCKAPSGLPAFGGAVLITCRDKGYYSPNAIIELFQDKLQAVRLLSRLTGKDVSSELEHLAEDLDFLPLMINIAGQYIAETPGINISNYSALLHENTPLKWIEFRKRYPKSLAATYLATVKLLEEKHPLSVNFLKEVSYLHHQNIPEELLTCWLEEKGGFKKSEIPLIKGDILRELINHSLIRYDVNKRDFSIHQLLSQTLHLDRQEKIDLTNILIHLESVEKYNPTQNESIRPFQKVLPHCLKVLEESHSISLAIQVARYFIDTECDFEKGKVYLNKADLWSQTLSHPIRGRISFLQGVVEYRQGNFQQALAQFDQALATFEQHVNESLYFGIEQNPKKCSRQYQIAICMQYQGQTLRELGLLQEASSRLEDALCAFHLIAEEHFDIARVLREQALILWAQNDKEKAICKLREAIEMQKRVYGDTYMYQPAVASTHKILGNFLFEMGEYQKADDAYQLAQTVNKTIYKSDEHPFQKELISLRTRGHF